jgi:hypothetical protein
MLSAVGQSAQVALQAGTIAKGEKSAERVAGVPRGKGKADMVTISTEAALLTRSALKGIDESQEQPDQQPREQGKEQKEEARGSK